MNKPTNVKQEFLILHKGWEMDNIGWITEENEVYTTSHGGGPYAMTLAQIEQHIAQTEESLAGLKAARLALLQ